MFNIHFIILFKVYVVSPLRVRPYQRSAPSTAFVMPSINFWDKDEVIVVSPQRNYTVNDYQALFNDIQFPTGYDYWINNKDLLNELKPPEIESHEIYGSQMPTPGVLLYNNRTFPDLPPVVLPDNGDGTVNIRSLLGFQKWQGKQKDDIHSFEIPGVDHLAILRHPMTINYVIQVLTGQFDRK
jgi:lysophospholipase-3